jgi:hypothetical protein
MLEYQVCELVEKYRARKYHARLQKQLVRIVKCNNMIIQKLLFTKSLGTSKTEEKLIHVYRNRIYSCRVGSKLTSIY